MRLFRSGGAGVMVTMGLVSGLPLQSFMGAATPTAKTAIGCAAQRSTGR
jgi:hypothetical protein